MLAYPVLSILGPGSDLELALAVLMEWGSLGAVEIEIEGGSGLRAFFPETTDVGALARELEARHPSLSCRPGPPEEVRDWLSEWKKSFTGFALGERFFVLPTWKPLPPVDRSVLRIDPEQAFGTGTHETTRLAARLLERLVRPGSRVVDLGAGTGILAMVAARLGASSVLAVEPDVDAARCARENVLRNELSEAVRVRIAAAEEMETIDADLVVANITRPVLESTVTRIDAPIVVLSGLLADEVDEFGSSLPSRLRVRETWCSGEWAALLLLATRATEGLP